MRDLFSIFIICWLLCPVKAQESLEINLADGVFPAQKRFFNNLELRYYTGRIRPHHEEMQHWKTYGTHGVELRLGRQGHGEQYWECAYQYPNYGLTAYWMTMGSDTLGQTGAIAGFTTFPLYRKNKFTTGLELTAGVAAGFNPNDPETNPNNYAIGSYLNIYFNFGSFFNYRFHERFSLDAGANLIHFSNASTRAPNLGINLLHYHFGLRYHLKPSARNTAMASKSTNYFAPVAETGFFVREKLAIQQPWGAHIALFGGFRQTLHTGNANYGVASLSAGLTYQMLHISKLALGLDLMYDASNIQFYLEERSQGIPHNRSNNYFVGLHGGHELHIERIAIILHAGYYLHKPEKVNRIYGRMGLRCKVGEKWWGNISFKVHNYTTAQYIEWGIGRDLF